MLSDLASGEADTWTGRRKGPPGTWDPRTVRPLLEHYLGMNMQQIDAAYRSKYHRYAQNIVGSVLTPEARSATIKLVPRAASSS